MNSMLGLCILTDCSVEDICKRWNERNQSADEIVNIIQHPNISRNWLIFYRSPDVRNRR